MSFSRSASEIQVSQTTDATVASLAVASAGLDAFFSDTISLRPQPGDSFRYNVADGYAWVVPEELQRPADTVLNDVVYSVRSTGYLIDPSQGATPVGVRTMVQFARWQVGSIQTQAMYTSASGIVRRTGGAYTLEAWSGGANNICQTGAQVPRTRTRLGSPAGDFESGLFPITGGAVNDSAVAAQTGIQWASIMAGNFEPDYYTAQIGDTVGFTSQLHVGDLTLTSGDHGSGLLIVTGNLITSGTGAEVSWKGIVLVGGHLRANAGFTDFHGLVVTGLNTTLGTNVPRDSVAGNIAGNAKSTEFLYEPCLVDSTLANLTGMVPVSRSRVDNWATY